NVTICAVVPSFKFNKSESYILATSCKAETRHSEDSFNSLFLL
ncbi:hypothetical protein PSYMO_36578, partial [Pseudomonas amygdali pv. mori str. 301020]